MNWIRHVLLLCLPIILGCSQSLYMQGRRHVERNELNQAIDAFYQELQSNPSSYRAWRELGVAYFKKGDFVKAEDALKQANNIRPDARTQLFLGLTYEKQAMWEEALRAYGNSLSLGSRGKTAEMTRVHLNQLMAKKIQAEVAKALENEEAIDVDTIPSNTVAVSAFDGSELPPDLTPIAYGLAEFVAVDLSKVKSLTVIERQKIDVIMEEITRGTTGAIDPATAPRAGRLLGSHRVVTGSVIGLGEDAVRIDGAIVTTSDGTSERAAPAEGELKRIFKMQKDFVFGLIDEMGITLTQAERDSIEHVPTESYLAFLAYCRGLNYKDQGMYQAAQQEFNTALAEDAAFSDAQTQLQETTAIAAEGAGSYSESLDGLVNTALGQGEAITGGQGSDDQLTNVLDNSGAIPGGGSDQTTNNPPVTGGTGTVIVRANLDVN